MRLELNFFFIVENNYSCKLNLPMLNISIFKLKKKRAIEKYSFAQNILNINKDNSI
jgi:hypothetical protein